MSEVVGFIYVIGSFEHLMYVKVGLSNKSAHKGRVNQLQTGNPFYLHVWGEFPVMRGKTHEIEGIVHKELSEFHFKNEWFNRHPEDMLKHVEKIVRNYNKVKRNGTAI